MNLLAIEMVLVGSMLCLALSGVRQQLRRIADALEKRR